jgi:peptide/nickel transport system substrate-binding protein
LQPPRTASELSIETFRQSPSLDAQVAAGELPPVEERLPDDPVVIEPFSDIGVYGQRRSSM